jgi:hypothetical protein
VTDRVIADDVKDKASMMKLLRVLDKANGYVFVPTFAPGGGSTQALWSSIAGDVPGMDVDDVQERWLDNKERWDEVERDEWRKEGEARAAAGRNEQPE